MNGLQYFLFIVVLGSIGMFFGYIDRLEMLMALLGVFTIFSAYRDYDWFMSNSRARPIVALFGRDGARVFYMLCGAAMIYFGFTVRFG